MKKLTALLFAVVLCLSMIFATTAFAAYVPYQVTIYQSGDEGLAIRAQPDVNSEQLGGLPDGNVVTVTQISNGWGYINQGGCEGWIYLQWTRVNGNYTADQPSYGYITPTNYKVYGTDGEGLEMRVSPTTASSTFGPIPEGTTVTVQAISGDWAYTSYYGNNGWVNMAHLMIETIPVNYQATVYGTGNEGLALKASADVNAARYLFIPEGAQLTFDSMTTYGWGHTYYNGYSGWVSLRYTKVIGNYTAAKPSWGYITPTFYNVIQNIDGDQVELRTDAKVDSSTFGTIEDGAVVLVEAIVNDWAYLSYNGHKGWANVYHLVQASVEAVVTNTDGEGLALKASADGSSQRYCMIPDGMTLGISQVTNGWGNTSYNNQQGWVAVRYTKLVTRVEPCAPTTGFISPKTYTVVGTENEGLALRTASDGENFLIDTIPEGTQITVTAIEDNWGFTTYNGHTGWVLMTYLR